MTTFLLTVLTATISLNVLGTPSCLHAMYRQAELIASFERPLKSLASFTFLYSIFAGSLIDFGRFNLSHISDIVLNPFSKVLSALLILVRFWNLSNKNIIGVTGL